MTSLSLKVDIPDRFLFRFAVPCRFLEGLARRKELPDECVLPNAEALEKPNASRSGATLEVRAAWSTEGMAFQFSVQGKRKTLWCNPNRPDESDRIELWLDTRNVRNVQRATRFCHRFACIPTGWGRTGNEATVLPLLISRAKQPPNDIPTGSILTHSRIRPDGYIMYVFFSAAALTGFDPKEFPEIGFNWELSDRDMGLRTFSVGAPFPYAENPALWHTLTLTR